MSEIIKNVKLEDIQIIHKPNCPWELDESHKLFLESCENGHLELHFKCFSCSLEYQVKTWRTGTEQSVASQFRFCPECGTKAIPVCLKVLKKQGPIYQN